MTDSNPYSSPLPLGESIVDAVNVPPGAVAFSGALTVNESREAARICTRREKVLLCVFVVILALGFTALVIRGVQAWLDSESALLALIVLPLTIVLMLGFTALAQTREDTLQHRRRFGIFQDRRGYITTVEIMQSTSSVRMQIQWSAFRGFRRGKTVVRLMWTDSRGELVLGRSQFATDDDFQRMLGMVGKQLPSLP